MFGCCLQITWTLSVLKQYSKSCFIDTKLDCSGSQGKPF